MTPQEKIEIPQLNHKKQVQTSSSNKVWHLFHDMTTATIHMFNGEVLFAETENTRSIIQLISDEYKVSPSEINLERLPTEEIQFFAWLTPPETFTTRVDMHDGEDYDAEVVIGDVYDENGKIFTVQIFNTEQNKCIHSFEIIFRYDPLDPTDRILFASGDQFTKRRWVRSDGTRFSRYSSRTPAVIWFNSLSSCMPIEYHHLADKLHHQIVMSSMRNALRLEVEMREHMRRINRRKDRGVCTCAIMFTCNPCRELEGIAELFQ